MSSWILRPSTNGSAASKLSVHIAASQRHKSSNCVSLDSARLQKLHSMSPWTLVTSMLLMNQLLWRYFQSFHLQDECNAIPAPHHRCFDYRHHRWRNMELSFLHASFSPWYCLFFLTLWQTLSAQWSMILCCQTRTRSRIRSDTGECTLITMGMMWSVLDGKRWLGHCCLAVRTIFDTDGWQTV